MAEHARRPSRRWIYGAAAVAAVVFIAYFIAWRVAAAEMKRAVHDWVANQRAAGLEISHGAISAGGFPFIPRVHVDAPAIAAPGAWRWRGDALRIDVLPRRLGFAPQDEQFLWAAGYGEWRATAGAVYFDFASDRKREWIFALKITQGAMTRAGDGAHIELASFDYTLAPDADDASTLVATFAAERLEAAAGGEAYALDHLQAALALSQTPWLVPPDPAAQWRAAGGALDIRKLNLALEEAEFSAEGAIRLDEYNRPAGLLQAELKNPAGLADFLTQTGALSPEEAESAAAGLTLMAIAGGGRIAAPIELKDGAASIVGVKIADLPRLGPVEIRPGN